MHKGREWPQKTITLTVTVTVPALEYLPLFFRKTNGLTSCFFFLPKHANKTSQIYFEGS